MLPQETDSSRGRIAPAIPFKHVEHCVLPTVRYQTLRLTGLLDSTYSWSWGGEIEGWSPLYIFGMGMRKGITFVYIISNFDTISEF